MDIERRTWPGTGSHPPLADSYTVIVPDLRGYGDSSKPGYSPQSEEYSFGAMAQDMVEVMASFGVKQWSPGTIGAAVS